MSYVIPIAHEVGDVVYELTEDCGVKEATVVYATSTTTESPANTTITYKLSHDDESLTLADSSNVFIDLATAITAYEALFV